MNATSNVSKDITIHDVTVYKTKEDFFIYATGAAFLSMIAILAFVLSL